MSGRYLTQKHRCQLPQVRGKGDIWECECGKLWRSISPGNPDYDKWVRVGWLGRLVRGIR